MDLSFRGEVIYWRGPAPWYFVPTDDRASDEIEQVARDVTYGWGCIPVDVRIGGTDYCTALFPKDGRFYVPVKATVRKKEKIDLGDVVDVHVTIKGA